MPNADYYRRHAEMCRRLARHSCEPVIARRFDLMALDFADQADEAEQSTDPEDGGALPDLHIIGDDPSGDIDQD
jgi:hypothetical protein